MPVLSTTATTTTTHEVKLRPTVKRKLLTELRSYAALKSQLDTLKHAMDKIKDTVQHIREETGEPALALDGFKITHVCPQRSTLDHKKLIELGCAAAWITEATVTKPTKDYERISCPGEKAEE